MHQAHGKALHLKAASSCTRTEHLVCLINQLNEVLQKLMDEGKIEEYTLNHLS